MEIRNNMNRLDPYLNRAEIDTAPGSAQAAQTASQAGGAKAVASPVFEGGDRVTLSSAALRDLVAREAAAAPDIRADKVEAVKAALADGTYAADARDIAARLLDDAF